MDKRPVEVEDYREGVNSGHERQSEPYIHVSLRVSHLENIVNLLKKEIHELKQAKLEEVSRLKHVVNLLQQEIQELKPGKEAAGRWNTADTSGKRPPTAVATATASASAL